MLSYLSAPLEFAVMVAGLPGRARFAEYLIQSNAEARRYVRREGFIAEVARDTVAAIRRESADDWGEEDHALEAVFSAGAPRGLDVGR